MEVNKKITKIVVNRDDELTDIVSGVVGSENERIVLTFAEDSDLLISPINLKVILETADEQEKLLILQVIKNPSGVRNATLAGLSVTDNPSLPTESMWENEIISRGKRLSKDVKEAEKNIREIEEESIESVQSAPVSDFQKRIDSAVEKSEKMVKSKNEDLGLTLDEDIPITYDDKDGVLGKDFSEREGNLEVENVEGTLVARKSTSSFSKFFASISSFVCKSIFPFFKSKFFVIFFVSLLLVGGLVLGVYYFSVIRVRVRVYVSAKEVSAEKIFEGDENIKEVNFDSGKIPVKEESVEKDRSTTIKATGVGYKGEKAKGKVKIGPGSGCTEEKVVVSAGKVLQSSKGLTFTLDEEVTVNCADVTASEASVTATEFGEEYNLASGDSFSVQGYSSQQLWGKNTTALSGGSKKEYTVLTQQDVNAGVESLKKISFDEGASNLKDKSGTTWEIIPDSISSSVVDGSVKTSVAVGQEGGDVDLSLKTMTKARYYMKDGLNKGIETLLTKEAKEKDLFSNGDNLELALGDEVEKSFSVVQSDEKGIKVKLSAKASVKPKVDSEEIAKKLKSMKWVEGNEFLKSLNYSSKGCDVEFNPSNFPESLKFFPGKQGGVLVEIKQIVE